MMKVRVAHRATAALTLALAPSLAWAQSPTEVERYWYGPHMGWPGEGWSVMVFGPLIMILLLALVTVVVVLAIRWGGSPWPGSVASSHAPAGQAPLDILKVRFAKGDIDKDEFEERRRVLAE